MSGWLPLIEEAHTIAECSASNASTLRKFRTLFQKDSEDLSTLDLVDIADPDGSALVTPIFLSHCKDDHVVPICNGEKLRQSLQHLGMAVEWKAYEKGGHWINEPQGVDDIVAFSRRCSEQTITRPN